MVTFVCTYSDFILTSSDKSNDSPFLDSDHNMGRRHFVLSGQSYQYLVHGVRLMDNLENLNNKNQQKLMAVSNVSTMSHKEVNIFVVLK